MAVRRDLLGSADRGQQSACALLNPIEAAGGKVGGIEKGVREADGKGSSVEPGSRVRRIDSVRRNNPQEGQGPQAGLNERRPRSRRREELLQGRARAIGGEDRG